MIILIYENTNVYNIDPRMGGKVRVQSLSGPREVGAETMTTATVTATQPAFTRSQSAASPTTARCLPTVNAARPL